MSLGAMKQALEALEEVVYWYQCRDKNDNPMPVRYQNPEIKKSIEAITFLRAAMEQAHGDWDEVEALRASLREHMAEIHRLQSALEQEPVAWAYPEGLEALKSGRPWTAYGSSGEGRIPLYLDAVARRVEPRLDGSGAGFESLPASSTWWDDPVAQMQREWQGLTDDDVKAPIQRAMQYFGYDSTQYSLGGAATVGFLGLVKEIEAKLKEKNT